MIDFKCIDINSPLLSIPIISMKDKQLICNYQKLVYKNSFCEIFYKKPIITNFVEKDLKAEIKEIEKENDDSNNYIKREDTDFIKYITVPPIIKAKNNIELSIIIPSSIEENKEELHKIKRILTLSINDEIKCDIIIEIYIQTIPIGIFISCEKYEIKYIFQLLYHILFHH